MPTKILIVDDENIVSEILMGFFCRQGYEVLYVSTGEEAIEVVKEKNPDIILLDICLPKPGMDGLETLEKIREFNKEVKVVVISGLEEDLQQRDKFKTLGVKYFLSKPWDPVVLTEVIKKIADNVNLA